MRMTTYLRAAAWLACLGLAFEAAAQDVTLRIANYGGLFTKSQHKYVAERFTNETKIKVEWIDGNPPDHLQKLAASRGRAAPFDVVYLDERVQLQAIEMEAVQKLDPALVPNLAKLYDTAKEKRGYGPAMLFWSWGLMYNVKAFKDNGIPEPESWQDLWNPKLAGKVSIADITGPGGVDFVLKSAQLAGGDEKNLAPGFDKIAQLKLHSLFSSSNDIRVKLLSGDVWIAPWNNGRSWALIDSGFPGRFFYPKEGGFLHTTTIDVVAGTKHPKEAQMYINYVLDPVSQLSQAYANDVPSAPAIRTLAGVLAEHPDVTKKFPASAGDLKQLAVPDWAAVYANFDKLVDDWNRRVKRK